MPKSKSKSRLSQLEQLESYAKSKLAKICGDDKHLQGVLGRRFSDNVAPKMQGRAYGQSVFINCPFDPKYDPLLNAATFAIIRCGFIPRCSMEARDSSQVRIEKLFRMIEGCRFGIHDLSRTELSRGMPRFNMPLELGVFLGAKRYGRREQDQKSCLVLERTSNSYDQYISDLSGCDPVAHGNKTDRMIAAVRDWLKASNRRKGIVGAHALLKSYIKFLNWLPSACKCRNLKLKTLPWLEFSELAKEWSKINP